MSTGSCLCGNVKYSFDGEGFPMICHCVDCRKTSGTTHSTNIIASEANFKVLEGTPKVFSKTSDSGNVIKSNFCGDCGSTLWRETPAFPGSVVVKVGTLDHPLALENAKPALELYTRSRPSWVTAVAGADQKETY